MSILKVLGTTMDQMHQTYCIGELPPIMLEGLLKNEKLSMILMPSMIADEMADINDVKEHYGECSCDYQGGIHNRVDGCVEHDPDGEKILTYENYMNKLLGTIEGLLEKMNNKEDETV